MKNIFLIIFSLSISLASYASSQGDRTKLGQDVPEFSIKTLDGDLIQMKNLRGKVVMINFFATWCGPCMQELPHIQKDLYPKFKNEDFVYLSIGREHSEAELRKFRAKKGFNFPMAADPKRDVYSLFAEKMIPRNYIISKEGKIVFQSSGFTSSELKKMIKIIQNELK